MDRDVSEQFGAQLYSYYLYAETTKSRPQIRRCLAATKWPLSSVPRPNLYHTDDLDLKGAFDVYLQREIHRRIHAQALEPVDLEPTTGELGEDLVDKVKAKFDHFVQRRKPHGGYTYEDLQLSPRQLARLERILPRWKQMQREFYAKSAQRRHRPLSKAAFPGLRKGVGESVERADQPEGADEEGEEVDESAAGDEEEHAQEAKEARDTTEDLDEPIEPEYSGSSSSPESN